MVFNSQAIEAAGIWMGIELRGQECGVLNSLNGFFFLKIVIQIMTPGR